MSKDNKFGFLKEVAKNRKDPEPAPAPGRAPDFPPSSSSSKRGGKRSDPDYMRLTTYIRVETHRKIKVALLNEGQGRELSELVEDLLSSWIEKKV